MLLCHVTFPLERNIYANIVHTKIVNSMTTAFDVKPIGFYVSFSLGLNY